MQNPVLGLCLLLGSLPIVSPAFSAQRRVLHAEMTHLRSGDRQEWSSFPLQAKGDSLSVSFEASANASPVTLGLRRVDVKEAWNVSLNGELVGRLFSDENDMQEVWELAPGRLREGTNELVIQASSERVDDAMFGEIWLDPRPRSEVFAEAQVRLSAVDEDGEPIPCRFTILNERGSLAVVGAESNDHLAVRSGVVYSATGQADLGLAAGRYTVLCGRGFEYSLDRSELIAAVGDQQSRSFTLKRVVDTAGLVACDTHSHTFEISRHGDATLDERMITLAGEGVELVAATDHNTVVDYRPYLSRLGLSERVTPIPGNEVTTKRGHFNVFPALSGAPRPDHQAAQWEDLFASIRSATPEVHIVILNHPRDVHSGFTPFAAENRIAAVGERLDGRTLQANAIELINSAALQSDPMTVFHDWLTEVNRGTLLTAVGSSDSHEVSRKIVGQGRSYVYVNDDVPGDIDVDAAVRSIVEGRVLVSLGLLTELTVDGVARSGETLSLESDSMRVAIRVQGPEWVQADRIELYANGELIRSQRIPPTEGRAAGVKASVQWQLPAPQHDVHLVALARGPGVTSLHWPIAKPYQPTSPEWEPYVFGCSGLIRLNVDGDGQWTSAKAYAEGVVQSAGNDFDKLIRALEHYDASTAAFAAHRWSESGGSIRDDAASQRLRAASPAVQEGFKRYAASQRESLDAQAQE